MDAPVLELTLEHMPDDLKTLHLALFVNVSNGAEIKTGILQAAAGPIEGQKSFDCAMIDAGLITSLDHLLAGVHAALLAACKGKLKTRTVHSEILYALGPTRNITQSLKVFGPSGIVTSILVVKVGTRATWGVLLTSLKAIIKGDLVDVESLGKFCDHARVKSVYKLADVNSSVILDRTVTGTVAAKFLS